MLKSLHHVGIVVEDMARSLIFYQSQLGGVVALDLMMDLPEFGHGVGIPGAKARIVFLQIPELSSQIELIQYSSPPGKRMRGGFSSNSIGSTHVAFLVADLNRVHKSFSERGVSFVSPPSALPADHPRLGGVKFCYFRDPDGALLELIELPN
ncbi:MAG: VOC family protein [Acidobacteria bacterium]|nr:VOC family protein [Nitrospiraceae bacterium]MCI0621873.1 VOC family protein [Acidobacteriota bacterium]MCI0720575.1 VOC family protein [Acidobacteriota bacterium]